MATVRANSLATGAWATPPDTRPRSARAVEVGLEVVNNAVPVKPQHCHAGSRDENSCNNAMPVRPHKSDSSSDLAEIKQLITREIKGTLAAELNCNKEEKEELQRLRCEVHRLREELELKEVRYNPDWTSMREELERYKELEKEKDRAIKSMESQSRQKQKRIESLEMERDRSTRTQDAYKFETLSQELQREREKLAELSQAYHQAKTESKSLKQDNLALREECRVTKEELQKFKQKAREQQEQEKWLAARDRQLAQKEASIAAEKEKLLNDVQSHEKKKALVEEVRRQEDRRVAKEQGGEDMNSLRQVNEELNARLLRMEKEFIVNAVSQKRQSPAELARALHETLPPNLFDEEFHSINQKLQMSQKPVYARR